MPSIVKATKANRSSYIPKETVPKESKKVYKEYVKSNDEGVIDLAKSAESGNYSAKDFKVIGNVEEKHKDRIQELTGIDTSGYKIKLRAQAIDQHINLRHGIEGKADSPMANKNDLSRIGYVIKNADTIDHVYDKKGNHKVSNEYTNKDGTRAKELIFGKKLDGHYYYVTVAVPDTKDKALQVVSVYITKKRRGRQGM